MSRRGRGGGVRRRSRGSPLMLAAILLLLLAIVGGGISLGRGQLSAAAAPAPTPAERKMVVEGGPDAEKALAQAAAARAGGGEPVRLGIGEPEPAQTAEPSLLAGLLPLLLTAFLSLLAGYVGGSAAFRATRVREHLDELDVRLDSHFKSTESQLKALREQTQRPSAPATFMRQPPVQSLHADPEEDPRPAADRPGAEPPPAPAPHPEPRLQPQRTAPSGTPLPDLSSIVARYGQLTRGNISRSEFARFFESLGESRPVEAVDGGHGLQETQGEGFLTAVQLGGHILVFPSYGFVANWHSQFTTLASVPENVGTLFDLELDRGGGGEIAMAEPALFDVNGGVPRRFRRGKITGFQG